MTLPQNSYLGAIGPTFLGSTSTPWSPTGGVNNPYGLNLNSGGPSFNYQQGWSKPPTVNQPTAAQAFAAQGTPLGPAPTPTTAAPAPSPATTTGTVANSWMYLGAGGNAVPNVPTSKGTLWNSFADPGGNATPNVPAAASAVSPSPAPNALVSSVATPMGTWGNQQPNNLMAQMGVMATGLAGMGGMMSDSGYSFPGMYGSQDYYS